MKNLLYLIFIALFSFQVLAVEIHAELQLVYPPAILKEGDLVEGLLKVWPLENADVSEFNKLETIVLANALVVTEIESVEVSANNADVVEAKVLMIVKRSKKNAPVAFNYKGQLIPIQTPALKIEAADKDPDDYYVMDQGLLSSYLGKIFIGIIILTSLMVMFWRKKQIKSFFQKLRVDPVAQAKKNYNNLFLQAASRIDYEKIYADRKEWLKLIEVQAPAYNEFFKIMEMHQYKKTWEARELSEVKESFDVIRGSLK